MSGSYFVGVDVGTGSVRAAVVDSAGVIKATAVKEIRIHNPQENFFEQSSENIWSCCCKAVRQALASSGVAAEVICGIGFDATCSLVVLDENFQAVTVSPLKLSEWNIIMWMDHRAAEQAQRITSGAHAVLQSVGGVMSPGRYLYGALWYCEMETPKLLWLKENMPDTWARARHFFDLPDFMTFMATGVSSRSLCSLVCKWTYVAGGSKDGWDEAYFKAVGLEDLAADGFSRIGVDVREPGAPIAGGLSKKAAEELGLCQGTPVGTSMIDAHAGGLGLFGIADRSDVSPVARHVRGVWGPYYSAMVPGLWLSEGGESATGKLLDHVVLGHRAIGELQARAEATHANIFDTLHALAVNLAKEKGLAHVELLAEGVHMLPYFHGNRSPLADSSLLGCFSGLSLSTPPLQELCVLYVACIQAQALGTRHIIEELNKAGYSIQSILMCGGLSHNPLYVQAHADATRCAVRLSAEPEAVLVGAAVLGAAASGNIGTLSDAMASMSRPGKIVEPQAHLTSFFDRKYKVFRAMHAHQLQYRSIMAGSDATS